MNKNGALKLLLQLFVAMVLVVIVSCSPTNKIIKSGDPELIYSHAVELYEQEEWKKAGQILEAVQPYYTGTMREDSITFYTARCQFKMNDFQSAIPLFDDFRRRFGRSVFLEDAEGMYALSHYYISPAVQRDQNVTQGAILVIDEFLSRYPESEQQEIFKELRAELLGRLYEKSYLNAYTYYKIGRYKSSILAFKNALKEYPDSYLREKIMYYTLLSAFELASNSILEKKEDRFLATVDSYYSFVAEYPESEYRKEADKMLVKSREYIDKQVKLKAEGKESDSEFDAVRNQKILRGEIIDEESVESAPEKRTKREKKPKLTKAEKRELKIESKEMDIETKEQQAKREAKKRAKSEAKEQ